MAEPLLEVKNLQVTYGSGRKAYSAVQNASFTIYKGETFGLVGESGSGKTTIGRAILRILPTTGGEILYKGRGRGLAERAPGAERRAAGGEGTAGAVGRRPAAGVCLPLPP